MVYEEVAFGDKSAALQKVTPEQKHEREKIYQQQLAIKLEKEKISNDDLNILVEGLKEVINDLEEILRQGVRYPWSSAEDDTYSAPIDQQKLGKYFQRDIQEN